MAQKTISFDDKKINKNTKKVFNIHEIDVDKVLISKKECYGIKGSLKYFIGYNEDNIIRPLSIKLPQLIGYVKKFDNNKTMLFNVNDKKLLKKNNKIWDKVGDLLNVKFDSDPVYGDNEKYIKTKIRTYEDNVIKNFQGKKMPKENASYNCIALVGIDCVVRMNKKCYPQAYLDEYKYQGKKEQNGKFN